MKLFSLAIMLFSTNFAISQPKTLKLGSTEWSTENLSVKTFRNGDPLTEFKSKDEWLKAIKDGTPGFCYHNNDPSTAPKFGLIYNIHAVRDKRVLAPEGYRIPSKEDVEGLIKTISSKYPGEPVSSSLKSTEGWKFYNGKDGGGGSNSSGFNLLPVHNSFGTFHGTLPGTTAGIFTSTGSDKLHWSLRLISDFEFIQFQEFSTSFYDRCDGLSVRCVKNSISETMAESITETVVVGNLVWMTANYNTITYANGDPIPQAKTVKEWVKFNKEGKGAFCYLDNDPKKDILYNYFALTDTRGIAPAGWRVPTPEEIEASKKLAGFSKVTFTMGYRTPKGEFTPEAFKTYINYWAYNPNEPFVMHYYSGNSSGSSKCGNNGSRCATSYGHYVKCVKNK